jgi:3-oxoadipate enol-lactonase
VYRSSEGLGIIPVGHYEGLLEVGPERCLHVVLDGPADGAWVLLLPALGTNVHLWSPQLALIQQGYRLIRIDWPGHGASPLWSAFSLDDLAAAVWRTLDHFGCSRVTMVGTSLGAVIALRSAGMRADDVQRLVLCGALLQRSGNQARELSSRFAGLGGDLSEIAARMSHRWFPHIASMSQGPRRSRLEALRDRVEAMVCTTQPEGYARCAAAAAQYDLLPELDRLQARTVLVTGDHDPGISEHFEQLKSIYPQVQLIRYPDAGHFPALEDPGALEDALQR